MLCLINPTRSVLSIDGSTNVVSAVPKKVHVKDVCAGFTEVFDSRDKAAEFLDLPVDRIHAAIEQLEGLLFERDEDFRITEV